MATVQPVTGPQETQEEFEARMTLGQKRRAEYVPPQRDPFRRLPVPDEEPW